MIATVVCYVSIVGSFFSGNLLVENLWKKVFGVYTDKQGILELRS